MVGLACKSVLSTSLSLSSPSPPARGRKVLQVGNAQRVAVAGCSQQLQRAILTCFAPEDDAGGKQHVSFRLSTKLKEPTRSYFANLPNIEMRCGRPARRGGRHSVLCRTRKALPTAQQALEPGLDLLKRNRYTRDVIQVGPVPPSAGPGRGPAGQARREMKLGEFPGWVRRPLRQQTEEPLP